MVHDASGGALAMLAELAQSAELAHMSTCLLQQAICLPAEPPQVWAKPLHILVPPRRLLLEPPDLPAEPPQVWAKPLHPLMPPRLPAELPQVWAKPLHIQVTPRLLLVEPWLHCLESLVQVTGLERRSALSRLWYQVALSKHGLPHARSTLLTE